MRLYFNDLEKQECQIRDPRQHAVHNEYFRGPAQLSYIKKVINFVKSRGLNQRQLSAFLPYQGTLVILLQILKQFWILKNLSVLIN